MVTQRLMTHPALHPGRLRRPHLLGGFSLLEVLLASTIGAALIGMLTMAFLGSRRAAERSDTLSALHLDAATIDRMFQEDIEAFHPGTKVDLRCNRSITNPAFNGTIQLTACTTLERGDTTMGLGQEHAHDVVWSQWSWVKAGVNNRPSLYRSLSAPYQLGRYSHADGGSTTTREIIEYPTPRRDRRGSLDYNDGRTFQGFSGAWSNNWRPNASSLRTKFGIATDQADLLRHRVLVHGNIEDMRISWIDQGGYTVAVASSGLTVTKSDGSTDACPPTITRNSDDFNWDQRGWWFEDLPDVPDLMRVDGTWSDGRRWTLGSDQPTLNYGGILRSSYPASDARTTNQRRPALMRISFTLTNDPARYDDPQRGTNPRWVRQRFTFSHPVSSTLPRPLP